VSATREERLKVLADAAEQLGLPDVAEALRNHVPDLKVERDGTPRYPIPDTCARYLAFHVELRLRAR